MLLLTRKLNESFMVGDATITVVRVGPKVRLGITAPPGTRILRCELVDRMTGVCPPNPLRRAPR